MSHKFPHLKFTIGEGNGFSIMFGLEDTGAVSNLGNMEYRQLVVEHQPNLVVKLYYLKGIDDKDLFNISGTDR